ncbi:late transcription factor VLTF3-like protein [Hokovirus HKV1]|uniref:Late transcription factor VLTF3-like protein n=1 Tax=Hokovirus HKV1 TaxID=1977638 RepID=A0A1V0SG44_9VIRU|nr:late transcription factor VLTF3-like protein [Hokovirus HKV1]
MVSLNLKPDKVRNRNNSSTLDQIHNQKCEMFKKNINMVENYKNKINNYTLLLNEINNKVPNQLSNEEIIMRSQYKDTIEKLSDKINDMVNYHDEIDYYSEAGDIILSYYNQNINDENNIFTNLTNDDKITNNTLGMIDNDMGKLKLFCETQKKKQKVYKETKHRKPEPVNKNNILSYYKLKQSSPENSDSITNEKKTYNENDLLIQSNNKKKKCDLFNEFRYIVDPNYIMEKNKNFKNPNKFYERCPECNVDKKINQTEGTLVCPKCGKVDNLMIEPEKINSKDKVVDKVVYPYKKMNHLNEWLNQIQAKQTTEIPNEMLDQIKLELKKNREYDLIKIKPQRIVEILKKIGKTKFKEHHILIWVLITGNTAPSLTREEEDNIREFFKMTQEPYAKYKTKGRINYSSYSFIIYKICELLGYTQITSILQLLKSPEKLRSLDITWKSICYDLGWKYIPSHMTR